MIYRKAALTGGFCVVPTPALHTCIRHTSMYEGREVLANNIRLMATYKNIITPYKLTKAHKVALTHYLKGTVGLTKTHERMGITKQRLYTMVAHIMRHSCTTGRINIEEILKDY